MWEVWYVLHATTDLALVMKVLFVKLRCLPSFQGFVLLKTDLKLCITGSLLRIVIPRPRSGEDIPGVGKVCYFCQRYPFSSRLFL